MNHASPTLSVTILRRRSGAAALGLGELWRFRGLLLALAKRDVKLRYRQTALGVAWVLLQPLAAAIVFAFIFGRVARLPTDGVPAFVFAFCGMLGWNLFSTIVTKSSASLLGHAAMISKVYFPRLLLPLSTLPSALVDFVITAIVLALCMIARRMIPGAHLFLLAPLAIVLLMAMALACGTLACALAVRYRDVQYVLPIVLQMLLLVSPIAYPVSAVPVELQTVYRLNPLTPALELLRAGVLNTALPPMWAIAYSSLTTAVLLVVALYIFKSTERNFADVI